MKIKSLTLHGFKSFADRTKVELHDGITAIVGPNGCGKSNISDALRWVLGEQRPTAIRGSRMEEAIFGGTEDRRPIHRAEVKLELSNEDGALPVPYSEVSIGRTVYRGGESEYTLNGATCRLKDILDLCRDTGLGSNAYAMIEGRMVDAILSDRAEERRSLFEEAAEIGRYKDRRRIASRRLEQAEADLQRLEDVLVEVQSKVRSLAQQRGRAERHGRLKKRLLQLEVAAADAHLERTERRLVEARRELDALDKTGPSEDVDLQTAETETETLRVEFAEMERERAELARRVEEARRIVEEQERTRLLAQERIASARDRLAVLSEETRQIDARRTGLRASLEEARQVVNGAETARARHTEVETALRSEVEALVETSREATATRETTRERLEAARRDADRWNLELSTKEERARDRSEELERRRPALEALQGQETELRRTLTDAGGKEDVAKGRLVELRDELRGERAAADETDEALRDLRERAAKLEGRLSAAAAQASSLAGLVGSSALLPETVAQLLEERDSVPGVHGALSEFLEVPAAWASAVESQLGPYLHGVVVSDWSAVQALQGWLERRDAADGVLALPLDPGPESRDPVASSSLLEHVETSGVGAPWVEALLSGVAAPEDAELARRGGPWVGSDGRRQDRWGGVYLGRPGAGDGVLSRRAELQAKRETVAELEAARADMAAELSRLEASARERRAGIERLESAIADAESERREAGADRASAAARLERLGEEREDLSGRIEQLEAFHESETARTADGADRTREVTDAVDAAEVAHRDAHAEAETARHAAEAKRADLHAAELEGARLDADLGSRREVMDRITEALDDAETRSTSMTEERDQLDRQLAENERSAVESEEAIAVGLGERSEREERLRDLEGRIEERREFLERRESELKDARRQERERTERRHALELEITQLDAAEAAVRGRLEAEWDATLEQLREQAEPIDEGDPQSWEEELETVRRSIARIGPVNLLAQQEYEEEKTRLEFLTEQRDDLVQARDDLRASIRRINKHAAEAFSETFAQVRDNFHRTFETLFEGGECDVWLEDPDDPLDSPIEISASPRGKKTQRIHLLSGGERALTALALLFAIYLAKPSPFCLLDEVDAPLDETNILRFVRMLEEFKDDTQFIVITHNPRTMEGADWIYGVTMQEPGVSSIVGVEFDQATAVA
ncbi:MAG: chromosome segregation protein SMC [Gemmatimonadetes bacterium]|nr:chromosome segregation protein SMC [Gemmatimonadota bacterium]